MSESLHSAIRNARTAVTGRENAGRQDRYNRAAERGLPLVKKWVATLDGRTRHDHGMADGQEVGLKEKFNVGGYKMMYPGDPSAPPQLVYNCRCTMVTQERSDIIAEPRQRLAKDENGNWITVNDMNYSQYRKTHEQNNTAKDMTYETWTKWVTARDLRGIIGMETSNGITITSISEHRLEQAFNRKVKGSDAIDAIKSPLNISEIKYDEFGQPSQNFLGEKATVTLNPETGVIPTMWPTSEKRRKRYRVKGKDNK